MTLNMLNWNKVAEFDDIFFDTLQSENGLIAKITINRPEVHNAFRPETVREMKQAFMHCWNDSRIGAVILCGAGGKAFCSGGDQKVRGHAGYQDQQGEESLNVLDLQKIIRSMPKPVIAMVEGYAIGGGHVLHVICDLSLAGENAIFGQTGPKVGSFDGGLGSSFLARNVGQKKAREIWYLCRQYNAAEALEMGLVNKVVPNAELEAETVAWAEKILEHSPTALRLLKSSFNAELDGQIGVQELAGNATMLFYQCEEAQQARDAFVNKSKPDFKKYRKFE